MHNPGNIVITISMEDKKKKKAQELLIQCQRREIPMKGVTPK